MFSKSILPKKPRALVIISDPSISLSLRTTLEKVGFGVKITNSGPDGMKIVQSTRPDIILLDAATEQADGFKTCIQIREIAAGKFAQILMVTSQNNGKVNEKAFEAGADGFITTPINGAMLGQLGKYMVRAGRAFQELERSKNRLSKAQEIAKLGNWEINLLTNEFQCSRHARKILGLDEQVYGLTFDDFLSTIVAEEQQQIKKKIEDAIANGTSFSANYRITHPDKTTYHIFNHSEILYNEENNAELMLGAVQDVTRMRLAEEEIRLLAFYDDVTGLANRILFLNRLEQEVVSSKRKEQKFALLYMDIDQFKRINDTFGHHIGDLLLRNISNVLQGCIRTTDIASRATSQFSDSMIARLGGDEFIIILSDIQKPENAAVVARRILQEIHKPISLEGQEITVTTSIGISLFPSDGEDGATLLKNADTAVYKAKNSGRNNYQFYKKSLNIASVERFSLERDLTKAIENNDFSLYFQPKIDLKNRKLVGGEALIRWIHPEKGTISPVKFIHLAEESGQIVAINKWVIKEACKQWSNWRQEGYDPGIIAVNLSGYQFAQHDLYGTLKDALTTSNLPPNLLEVEITENILMQDTDEITDVLSRIKQLGLRIALDDFGTGYSSLSYLTSFDVDTIKIDRSFVMEYDRKPNNLVIIKAIIAMGHSLDMTIVAEGVETEKQFKMIKSFGAEHAQGYLFSPPVDSTVFTKLLAKNRF